MKVELEHFVEFISVMRPNSHKLHAAVAKIARVYMHAIEFAKPRDTLSLRVRPGGAIKNRISFLKAVRGATGWGLKEVIDIERALSDGHVFEFKLLRPDQVEDLATVIHKDFAGEVEIV